eukprot:TRINITY_DN6808_c2_g1_i1.p1 TRINITY_DN6808_c2_g1~~TRINITY_DN6808_c2_g1_i1.p1  ORF type:complete len:1476 (+),score=504.45 TRINITY_DN6808_c2_g1_i1:159-4586(+)
MEEIYEIESALLGSVEVGADDDEIAGLAADLVHKCLVCASTGIRCGRLKDSYVLLLKAENLTNTGTGNDYFVGREETRDKLRKRCFHLLSEFELKRLFPSNVKAPGNRSFQRTLRKRLAKVGLMSEDEEGSRVQEPIPEIKVVQNKTITRDEYEQRMRRQSGGSRADGEEGEGQPQKKPYWMMTSEERLQKAREMRERSDRRAVIAAEKRMEEKERLREKRLGNDNMNNELAMMRGEVPGGGGMGIVAPPVPMIDAGRQSGGGALKNRLALPDGNRNAPRFSFNYTAAQARDDNVSPEIASALQTPPRTESAGRMRTDTPPRKVTVVDDGEEFRPKRAQPSASIALIPTPEPERLTDPVLAHVLTLAAAAAAKVWHACFGSVDKRAVSLKYEPHVPLLAIVQRHVRCRKAKQAALKRRAQHLRYLKNHLQSRVDIANRTTTAAAATSPAQAPLRRPTGQPTPLQVSPSGGDPLASSTRSQQGASSSPTASALQQHQIKRLERVPSSSAAAVAELNSMINAAVDATRPAGGLETAVQTSPRGRHRSMAGRSVHSLTSTANGDAFFKLADALLQEKAMTDSAPASRARSAIQDAIDATDAMSRPSQPDRDVSWSPVGSRRASIVGADIVQRETRSWSQTFQNADELAMSGRSDRGDRMVRTYSVSSVRSRKSSRAAAPSLADSAAVAKRVEKDEAAEAWAGSVSPRSARQASPRSKLRQSQSPHGSPMGSPLSSMGSSEQQQQQQPQQVTMPRRRVSLAPSADRKSVVLVAPPPAAEEQADAPAPPSGDAPPEAPLPAEPQEAAPIAAAGIEAEAADPPAAAPAEETVDAEEGPPMPSQEAEAEADEEEREREEEEGGGDAAVDLEASPEPTEDETRSASIEADASKEFAPAADAETLPAGEGGGDIPTESDEVKAADSVPASRQSSQDPAQPSIDDPAPPVVDDAEALPAEEEPEGDDGTFDIPLSYSPDELVEARFMESEEVRGLTEGITVAQPYTDKVELERALAVFTDHEAKLKAEADRVKQAVVEEESATRIQAAYRAHAARGEVLRAQTEESLLTLRAHNTAPATEEAAAVEDVRPPTPPAAGLAVPPPTAPHGGRKKSFLRSDAGSRAPSARPSIAYGASCLRDRQQQEAEKVGRDYTEGALDEPGMLKQWQQGYLDRIQYREQLTAIESYAAATIQIAYRYYCKKRFRAVQRATARVLQCQLRMAQAEAAEAPGKHREAALLSAQREQEVASAIQGILLSRQRKGEAHGQRIRLVQAFARTKLSALWATHRHHTRAAIEVQRIWKGHRHRSAAAAAKKPTEPAAAAAMAPTPPTARRSDDATVTRRLSFASSSSAAAATPAAPAAFQTVKQQRARRVSSAQAPDSALAFTPQPPRAEAAAATPPATEPPAYTRPRTAAPKAATADCDGGAPEKPSYPRAQSAAPRAAAAAAAADGGVPGGTPIRLRAAWGKPAAPKPSQYYVPMVTIDY